MPYVWMNKNTINLIRHNRSCNLESNNEAAGLGSGVSYVTYVIGLYHHDSVTRAVFVKTGCTAEDGVKIEDDLYRVSYPLHRAVVCYAPCIRHVHTATHFPQ
jgi:hypothetical protein